MWTLTRFARMWLKMKLFEFTNGYTGYSYVRVLVIAKDEVRGYELASGAFKQNAIQGSRFIYPENYWTELHAKVLAMVGDCLEWVGEINE